MAVQPADHLLGQGIYDVAEIARLVRRTPYELSGWATKRRGDGAVLLLPRRGRLFSFYDLITAAVAAELRQRQVSTERIRDARQWLLTELQVESPFANREGLERLATAGERIYYRQDDHGWLDASAGGQFPIAEVVEPLLRRLDFEPSTRMASGWRPAEGVLLNPAVQAGAPCLAGTRLTTELVADLVNVGEDPEDIAEDYAVDLQLVRQAIAYELALAA